MTQTVLSEKTVTKKKKYTPALHNGLFYANSNRITILINFVLHLLALPFILLMLMNNFSKGYQYHNMDELVVVTGVICTFAGVVSGIFTVCSVFKSMYNRQHMDMEFSMPMSSKSRFLSDYLGGLFVYTAPYLAAEIVSLILWGIGSAMFDGKTLTRLDDLGRVEYTWYCTFFADNFKLCVEFIFGGFLIMLMFYTFWTFVMTCCGSMFEVIIYGFAANIVPPALLGTVYLTLFEDLYGIDRSNDIMRLIGITSPGGGAFGLIASSSDEANIFGSYTGIYRGYWEWALLMIIVTVIVFAAAFFLYYRRTAEKTGQPFAYRLFYNIILVAVTFAVCCISMRVMFANYSSRTSVIAAMIIITFIVFMLLEFFSNRGFKKFPKSLLKYGVTVACSCVFYYSAMKTGFFGMVSYVPSVESVSSVEINYSGFFQDSDFYDYKFTDKESIKLITDVHRHQIDILKNDVDNDFSVTRYLDPSFTIYDPVTDQVVIKYHLIGGKTVVRNYSLWNSSRLILQDLDTSDVFKQQFIKNISDVLDGYSLNADQENELRDFYGNSYKDIRSISVYDRFQLSGNSYKKNELPADFAERLKENLTIDINSMSADEFLNPSSPDYGIIEIPIFGQTGTKTFVVNDYDHIVIRGCYKNTADYLKSIGVEFPEFDISNLDMMIRDSYMTIRYLDHENIDSRIILGHGGFHYYGSSYNGYSIRNADAEVIKEILDNSFTEYIFDESCYTISAGSYTGYIPKEYAEKAEQVFMNNADTGNTVYEYYDDDYYDDDYYEYYEDVPAETVFIG